MISQPFVLLAHNNPNPLIFDLIKFAFFIFFTIFQINRHFFKGVGMSIKKWLLSLVTSAFMVTAVFASDDDDKVFSLPFYSSVLCPYPIFKDLPKCDSFIKLNEHKYKVYSVAFSQNSQLLASGSYDDTIKIWDTSTWKPLLTLEGHRGSAVSVTFSPDGQWLASSSDENTFKIWNPNTGKLLRTLEDHKDWVRSVMFSPNGEWLASGSDDNTIKIWDPNTGDLLHTLEGHRGSVKSVAFSHDDQLLASGSNDYTIIIWDLDKILK